MDDSHFAILDGQSIEILGQAILGSSLYVLFRAQKFLADRAFDPRYNSVYFTRWVTGVISGVVLAYLPLKAGGGEVRDFSPGLLALLGGFTAEAVELILKRLVEILVTAVNGDSGETTKVQMEAAQKARETELLAKIVEIKVEPDTPEAKAVEQIKAMLKQAPSST